MNQKGFTNIILIVIIIALTSAVGYFAFVKKSEQIIQQPTATPTQTDTPAPTPASPIISSLSGDHKSIVADDKILLTVDDDAIFNFFKTESQLCDVSNTNNNPDRKIFCEDKATFKSKTRFASIVSSSNRMKIGFNIESDALSPDKVVGIFYPTRETNKIHFLTNYYLGNEFISFSQNGAYFVYQGNCWEAMCGLFIKNSETLADKIDFNNPKEGIDARSQDSEFVRWLSNGEVEYKLGAELKQASF